MGDQNSLLNLMGENPQHSCPGRGLSHPCSSHGLLNSMLWSAKALLSPPQPGPITYWASGHHMAPQCLSLEQVWIPGWGPATQNVDAAMSEPFLEQALHKHGWMFMDDPAWCWILPWIPRIIFLTLSLCPWPLSITKMPMTRRRVFRSDSI